MPLSLLRRFSWVVLLLAAIGFLAWTTSARINRINHVTQIGRDVSAVETSGLRELIVPEHIIHSYAWIRETEAMREAGAWRVRATSLENAPEGREVHAASPYRWWLAAVGAIDRQLNGGSIVRSNERAALVADPLLHGLLLVLTSIFVALAFGGAAACWTVLAVTLLFPFAAGFLPGTPDDFSLGLALTPWIVLPLLLGSRSRNATRRNGCFAVAGLVAGVMVWTDVAVSVPLLVGVGIGALLNAWATRETDATIEPDAWRAWALGGAVTVFVGYLLEYAPAHLGEWELRAVHPVYALAWLGAGEVLANVVPWVQGRGRPRSAAAWIRIALGLAALASLPITMARAHSLGFFNVDLLAFRLTKEAGSAPASNTWLWFGQAGLTGESTVLVLSAIFIALAVWLTVHRRISPSDRAALALTMGPILIALAFAQFHLRWWQTLGALAIALGVVIIQLQRTGALPSGAKLMIASVAVLALGFSAPRLMPSPDLGGQNVLSLPEVEGLVERDLAHTLARRIGDPSNVIIHAPPGVSTTLAYYGNLPGLCSLAWENKPGLSVALRIVISTSREEAHALVLKRGVTHLVIPSWDPFFDAYTKAASVQSSELFYNSLRRWVVPGWLRPIPYQMPTIGGFENQSVTVFEVVDEQEPPIAMSRMTEYFIEMGQLESAKAAGETLRRYPADFSALIARAQLEAALRDPKAFSDSLDTIVRRIRARSDRLLPLDRRLSLAVVLARGQRMDLARTQVERCLEQLDERRLRFLTTHQQFHLLFLAHTLNLPFTDPRLHQLALDLIPAESRAQLQQASAAQPSR